MGMDKERPTRWSTWRCGVAIEFGDLRFLVQAVAHHVLDYHDDKSPLPELDIEALLRWHKFKNY